MAVSLVSFQPPLLRCGPGTVTESDRAWWGGGTGTSEATDWLRLDNAPGGSISTGGRTFRYVCRGATLVSVGRS